MSKGTRILPPRDARVNVRLNESLRRRLAALAKDDGRSLSSYIERVLADHVENHQKTDGRKGK